MGGEVKGGNGRYKAVTGGIILGALVVTAAYYRPLPPLTALYRPDIHSEYVKYLSGNDTVTAYLAYPESPKPAPAVIVIHEIFGMSDFIRQTTEQLAKDGFVAIAPDLLSRRGGTPSTPDSARKLIATLNPDTVTMDLDATRVFLDKQKPVRSGEIGIIGFCWGGGQASATRPTRRSSRRSWSATAESNTADMSKIRAKGLGVYAENDARIDAGLPDAAAAMKAAGKDYKYTVYPGVGHGFLRTREKPEVADSAWSAAIRFFRAHLKS
jgi:carboxymethylenebutenolidase